MWYHLLFCSQITDLTWKGILSLSHSVLAVFQALNLSGQAKARQAPEKVERRLASLEADLSYSLLVFFSFLFFFNRVPSSRPYP